MAHKMHADERDIDVALVELLVARQFPEFSDLPVKQFPSSGTSNSIFRLGEDMAVRLPRIEASAAEVDKEHLWLSTLAPLLPVPIPIPLAKGSPGEGYPWRWSIYRWMEGDAATKRRQLDGYGAARDLGRFVAALQRIDPSDAPTPGERTWLRGMPLTNLDPPIRWALAELVGKLDVRAAERAWDAALRAPSWDDPPVWFHGDLLPGNLLVNHGRLSAVIDWGCLGAGDPACDMLPAWSCLSAGTRDVFRSELDVDDGTWVRGRGWALYVALVGLVYYENTNPGFVRVLRRTIAEVLGEDQPDP